MDDIDSNLLQSQLHNSSTDQLHQSLRLLVRKIRAQLEVLTKKNKLKEEENLSLQTEISTLKQQISNLETIIISKTDTESHLTEEIKQYKSQIEANTKRHSAIESQLLSQISLLRKEKTDIIDTHIKETNALNTAHALKMKEERHTFTNLRNQKLALDTKLQEIMTNNDELYQKIKELQTAQSNKVNINKNEFERLKQENLNYLSTIQELKNEINRKDKEITEIGMSVIAMQNSINHLQTETDSNTTHITEYQSKLKISEEKAQYYQTHYEQLQTTMDEIIDASKSMDDEPFWPIDDQSEEKESDVFETTANPFPISNEMGNHKRLLEVQMFPKRIHKLQKELVETQNKLQTECDNHKQVTVYWKNKTKEISTKNADLNTRMQDFERMLDELSSTNDNLLKENDSLKAKMHNNKFTSSAHEIFLQMKTKEETQKTIELQQELDVLTDDLCRKDTLIKKLESQMTLTKENMDRQQSLHASEMQQLTNKLHELTQLSQEEIQQTFHLTIAELQSILDINGTTPDSDTQKIVSEMKENNIDLSPKVKPHITDSDIGDNDDMDIIEAEDKLASYFARHKQRQLHMNANVEAIPEANEEECVQKVEIVDDECKDEPPLDEQEEVPYIVDAYDAMSRDVSVSNVANSACSSHGDESPVSKIDEPPIKVKIESESKEEKGSMGPSTKESEVVLHCLENFLSGSSGNMISPQPQLQALPHRTRSMGSMGGGTATDDVMSVDQSMLAHDGSRDGSVVPEQRDFEACEDGGDNVEESTSATQLVNASEYIASEEVCETEITVTDVKGSMDNSVEDIHNEARGIIEDVQQNLKELERGDMEVSVPMIVQEDMEITNDDILGPLVEREKEHKHRHMHEMEESERERRKELLSAAKMKWSMKVEEMIANTDEWFINEDGDIVLIYPEGTEKKVEKNEESVRNGNGNENKENIAMEENVNEVEIEEAKVENEDGNNENVNVNVNEEVIIADVNEKSENMSKEVIKEKQMNINDSANDKNASNDTNKANDNMKKNENFFNSFRIF